MANYHNIKAQLYDNALPVDNPNDLVGVLSERSLSVADICRSVASRGGADGTYHGSLPEGDGPQPSATAFR